jgi:hypothetical protein
MVVRQATPGMQGGDINAVLNAQQCKQLIEGGLSFVIRYLPRTSVLAAGNLTLAETDTILTSGLALSAVQHAAIPGWQPSAGLGQIYGKNAGIFAAEAGLLPNMNIWLDLEEVAEDSTAADVIAYCNGWYAAVAEAGYLPGLYVGWGVKLSSAQLYSALSFRSYWESYNADIPVATRGYQLIQHPQQTLGDLVYDPDTVQKDELGDLPLFVFSS